MANVQIVDGNGDAKYLAATGAGTSGDPHVMRQSLEQANHDSLNGNANLQVGNADVGSANPVPVSDAGGALTVDQAAHDNLNCNANVQVGNADAGLSNPLPVSLVGSAQTLNSQYTTSADLSSAAAAVTAAPTSGQKICLDELIVSVGTAMVVTFTEETSGTVFLALALAANTPVHIPLQHRIKLATADKKLMAQASVSGNVYITTVYHSQA